jgi:hypothetical protein
MNFYRSECSTDPTRTKPAYAQERIDLGLSRRPRRSPRPRETKVQKQTVQRDRGSCARDASRPRVGYRDEVLHCALNGTGPTEIDRSRSTPKGTAREVGIPYRREEGIFYQAETMGERPRVGGPQERLGAGRRRTTGCFPTRRRKSEKARGGQGRAAVGGGTVERERGWSGWTNRLGDDKQQRAARADFT